MLTYEKNQSWMSSMYYGLILSTIIFYSSIPGLQIQISYVTEQYDICVYQDRFKITFSWIAPDFVFFCSQGTRCSPSYYLSFPPVSSHTQSLFEPTHTRYIIDALIKRGTAACQPLLSPHSPDHRTKLPE